MLVIQATQLSKPTDCTEPVLFSFQQWTGYASKESKPVFVPMKSQFCVYKPANSIHFGQRIVRWINIATVEFSGNHFQQWLSLLSLPATFQLNISYHRRVGIRSTSIYPELKNPKEAKEDPKRFKSLGVSLQIIT